MEVSTKSGPSDIEGVDGIFPAGCPSRTVLDHSFTDRGRGLVAALLPLMTWIAEHAGDIVDSSGAAGSAGALNKTAAP